jgi:hypothetical protein
MSLQVVIIVCLGLSTSHFSGTQAALDLSGIWKLDSRAGSSGYPADVGVVLKVAQTGETISIEQSFTGLEMGDGTIRDVYVVSGKRERYSVKAPTGQTVSGLRTSRWVDKGRVLEVADEADNDSPAGPLRITSQATWRLSDDGRTLTIVRYSQSPLGERQLTQVFRRQ